MFHKKKHSIFYTFNYNMIYDLHKLYTEIKIVNESVSAYLALL